MRPSRSWTNAAIYKRFQQLERQITGMQVGAPSSGGAAVPSSSQFLGYFDDENQGAIPAADATTYGKWYIVRLSGGKSEEYICHQNSETFIGLGAPRYEWIRRSQARG